MINKQISKLVRMLIRPLVLLLMVINFRFERCIFQAQVMQLQILCLVFG